MGYICPAPAGAHAVAAVTREVILVVVFFVSRCSLPSLNHSRPPEITGKDGASGTLGIGITHAETRW